MNVSLTNRCNLQCAMCDIWKEIPTVDIPPGVLDRVLASDCLAPDAHLTLTGGEPFLHPSFRALTRSLAEESGALLWTVSTNGTMAKQVIDFLKLHSGHFPHLTLSVSFDGPEGHVLQRGVPAEVVLGTIREVRTLFPSVMVKLKMTVTPLNYTEIRQTYELAETLGATFKVKAVEDARNYTNRLGPCQLAFTTQQAAEAAMTLERLLSEGCFRDQAGQEFVRRTAMKLLGVDAPFRCSAVDERVFIMPNGDCFACVHRNPIGNVCQSDLDRVWHSEAAARLRGPSRSIGCRRCVSFHGSAT